MKLNGRTFMCALVVLYVLLSLFSAAASFEFLSQDRFLLAALSGAVCLLESATASLIWIAAPVRNRW